MTLNSGEVIGLLGPNGAGKSTFFYMIVGLINSSQGNIILNKKNITNFPIYLRARYGIGYLPQEISIFRKLTVEENIMTFLESKKYLSKVKRKYVLESLLEEFNIQHIRYNIGYKLSGGECRRVEIARLLAISPKFILLDEPFAGVDPVSINDIKKIISYLTSKGIGILITDHNVRDTLDICKHIYILNSGSVIASGNTQHVLNDKDVKRLYFGKTFNI